MAHKNGKSAPQGMKPDKACHTGSDYKTAKTAPVNMPGQMYVPKTYHNTTDFATLAKNK